MILIMIVLTTACGNLYEVDSNGEEEELEPLKPIEQEKTTGSDETEEGYKEVDVQEPLTESMDTDQVSDAGDTADSVSDNGDGESGEAQTLTATGDTDDEMMEPDEYKVLDLSDPADRQNYSTGLVFIRQEGDIWRTVDRMGNVYRVSSSYTGLVQGIVNRGATVTIDGEGNRSVSLTRDYQKYENSYVLQASKEEAPKAFAEGLLELQKTAVSDEAKIDDYILQQIEVIESRGKGIVTVRMSFDVIPAVGSTSWGDGGIVEGVDYTFTLYGYEDTWILPVKAPLYMNI